MVELKIKCTNCKELKDSSKIDAHKRPLVCKECAEIISKNFYKDLKVLCPTCKKKVKYTDTLYTCFGRECKSCIKKRKQRYYRSRKSLIGKIITAVNWGKDGQLYLKLNNGKVIEIADGEYGDDCSRILNEKEIKITWGKKNEK